MENSRAGRQANPTNTQTNALPQGKSYLFVIGIDNYKNHGIRKLYNPILDAKAFVTIVTEKYQFAKDEDLLITLYDEEATQANIYKKLDRLEEIITNQDNLLIYFSGHGEYREKIDLGFWIPYDGDPDNPVGSYISFKNLMSYIEAIDSFHTFIIADSCYSGTLFTARSVGNDVKTRYESIPSRWLLTAGRKEPVPDGVPGEHSPFAKSVLTWLNSNQDNRLSVADFCRNVINSIDSSGSDQTPQGESLRIKGNMGGEFMFRLKAFANEKVVETVPTSAVSDTPKRSVNEVPVPVQVVEPVKPIHNLDDLRKRLKTLIASDEFEQAFDLLGQAIDENASISNSLISLQGQYNGMRKQQNQGTVSDDFANRTLNRIRIAVTDLVNKLKEDDITSGYFKKSTTATPAAANNLSDLEREGLENQINILQNKLNFFLQQQAILSDASQKFTLQMQIDEVQKQIIDAKGKLGIG